MVIFSAMGAFYGARGQNASGPPARLSMDPRTFRNSASFRAALLGLLAIATVGCGSAPEPSTLRELTIAEYHVLLRRGRIRVEEVTAFYLDRIARLDGELGSMITINDDALQRARELDQELAQTGRLRPLHGVPMIVKDNYDTADLPTSAGSQALAESLPPDDATQVRQLRAAGALVLGKSNMAEWAFSPYETVSSRGGVTRNPYDLERVPAGSSGGTAAAIAADFGLIGLGTDTGNSIRGPSAHCSLVGLRPTLGLTSRDGIVPLYLRNDVGGPMTRTVEDAARVMDVIAGVDPADPVTALSVGKLPDSFLTGLRRDALQGTRIGVLRDFFDPSPDPAVLSVFTAALEDLRRLGAEIVDPVQVPRLRELSRGLWRNTFRDDLGDYLRSLGESAPVRSLAEVLESGGYHESVEGRIRDALQRPPAGDERARNRSADPADDPRRSALLAAVEESMNAQGLDALVFPSWTHPPRPIGDLENPHGNLSPFLQPHTGQPGLTVPMGFTPAGLPLGLQFLGRRFADAQLLGLGYAYEQGTGHRQPPAGY